MSRDRIALGFRLKDAARRSQAASHFHGAAIARFLGINHTDGMCLEQLDRIGKMTPGQIAEQSGLTTGAVTAVLDRLEKRNYVRRVRDKKDRRRIWIELTDTLRGLMGPLFEHYIHLNDAITDRFTPEQIDAIVAYLEIDARINQSFTDLLERVVEDDADNARRAHRLRKYLTASQDLIETLSREIAEV